MLGHVLHVPQALCIFCMTFSVIYYVVKHLGSLFSSDGSF